ncbi:PREDICTED: transcription elongation factor B polypeptide 3-like [Vollenhovia emeryi]|uniref:transcription elongation factor B polypeptide 3-like n=1 Tax=Vollenhovia emeryi TaxID=411798 RepID=UPI0005F3F2BB|nr:PREDICTED: transcription elongation factor B polypeptide 3-like [Vollenhovia emeryi]XP_011875398.1 PREDICTED: transcription elongation factor B polypeptide 3-like [Vollenhovia emeryi]
MSIVDKISHYQRNLENCADDEDRILHYISKLYKLPVTVQHLQQTGVGRTVNSLRKYNDTVGDAAKSLVFKWKNMVADDRGDSSDKEDEDEACVIDDNIDDHKSPKAEDMEESDSSSDQQSESKYTHRHKENESKLSAKHSVVHLSKSKLEEKQELHGQSRHSSKYHLHSEKKSKESKSSKSSSLDKEAHSSKLGKNDSSKKVNDKTDQINEDNNRKRKVGDSSSLMKEYKKRKQTDGKKDDEKSHQTSISEHSRSHLKSSGIQIEVKIKVEDEQFLTTDKQDVKQAKYLQEKSKSSSSKLKSQESDSKAKDSSDKKHKKEDHTSHKKYDMKKDTSHRSSKETSKLKVSSSSSKDYIKIKDKDTRKERKDDKSKHEKKKETRIKLIQEINDGEGIDCNSGASFAEALGMCSLPQPSKKRPSTSNTPIKSIKTERMSPPVTNRKMPTVRTEPECSDNGNPLSLLAPNVKLEPLSVDLASTLPEISPNYKPLPYINPSQRKEETKFVDDIIYVKNQRTKVYSGNKVGYTSVPTLYEMCIRVLIENIDALEFTGGVPYDILKPILERASSDQLFMLEHHNPYLVEDTDILWQYHCNREFRNKERQETESWREMYMRCLDEREAKLKTLTANIKQSIDKSVPVRSAKLAYVDNIVKPPRNVLKKQAKYGTANATPATVSSVKKKLTSGGATNNATNIAVPPPPMSRFKPSTSSSMKKTKAPLMAKALQLIKGRYKR